MSDIKNHLENLSQTNGIPMNHFEFLVKLRDLYNFYPKTIYDIGACVLHWTNQAKKVWPDANYILFDAFEEASFLYTEYQHHVGVLSHLDGQQVKWYQNEYYPGGNSYYREIGHPGNLFPIDKFIIKKTRSLDSVCIEKNFELPDLIKIDVQGSEMDIIKGASKCLEKAKYLIVEMQHVDYNENAPKVFETKPFIESLGWKCIAEKFSDNGCDADYCFVKEL